MRIGRAGISGIVDHYVMLLRTRATLRFEETADGRFLGRSDATPVASCARSSRDLRTPTGADPFTDAIRSMCSKTRRRVACPTSCPSATRGWPSPPFGFLRGAAAVMALDLSTTPATGLNVQACGDAHIRNFGHFATPERNLAFSINDFDETLPAPVGVGRQAPDREPASRRPPARLSARGVSRDGDGGGARVPGGHGATTPRWRRSSSGTTGPTSTTSSAHFPARYRPRVKRDMKKAQKRDPLGAVAKLTHEPGGDHQFVEDPPLIVHLDRTDHDMDEVEPMLEAYRSTLRDDRRGLLDRFHIVDVARKVVGVGSVGTRVWVCLFEGSSGRENDHMILQVKEAQTSVLAPYVGAPRSITRGDARGRGQRVTQGPTDIFLGWCEGPRTGRQYYVRQLWDAKGRSDLTKMGRRELTLHGSLCAYALAACPRANGRRGADRRLPRELRCVRRGDRDVCRAVRGRRPGRTTPRCSTAITDGRVTAQL